MEDPELVGSASTPFSTPLVFTSSSLSLMVNLTGLTTNIYDNYTTFNNESAEEEAKELPRDLREMSESSKHCVIAYCVLFIIATSGNLTVLLSVFKQYKKTKSRISLLILHLSIADLIVSCTLIPTEIFWRLTIQWRGGNELCKVMQFLRAFGLYLSSMVLICVSFDRFFAILFPMKMLKRAGRQRIKIMLWLAWIASATFSAPQAILFSIESHPEFPSFKQCVANEYFKNCVRMYSIFSVSAMYFAPLVVILFTYTAILIKIIRKAHQGVESQSEEQPQHHQRNRHSIRFRMSIRNFSSQRGGESSTVPATNSLSAESAETATATSTAQRQHHHHNHSRLTIGSTHSRNKSNHQNTLSGADQGEFSSEEGSNTGSTCSTMNVTATTLNNSGSGVCHTPSPSPDVVTLGRVNSNRTHLVLRRSENAASTMSRAKHRTLVMTIVIVVVFVLCWTPYVVMTLWYMFDWEGAQGVDSRIQEGLFVMAVANSCVNPLIYGSFAKNCCGLSNIIGRMRRTRS